MNTHPAPNLTQFRAILLGTFDQYSPHQPDKVWELCDGQYIVPCLIPCSGLLHRLLSRPLESQWFRLADWRGPDGSFEGSMPVVTGANPDEFNNDALNLLPPNACPADGVHARIMALINQIQTTPLRSLVESTLQDREVCSRFWTMPASAQHHHAFPGGLATHCLEVAQDLAGQSCLEGHERDLCIAAGLLHDIGKIWAYTQDMFLDTPARAMGHELLGLSRLERNLMALEVDWPDGAYAMRVLLSGCGRMRHDGTMPSALVSRLKAADQRSCENERARREPLRAWRPKRWLSSFIPEDDPTPME